MFSKPQEKEKCVTKKSTAIKEMEAWARTNDPTHEESRYLYDNIADREERVLRVTLKKLAKERHKYLVNSAFEKKRFIERSKLKKSGVKHYYTLNIPNREVQTDVQLRRNDGPPVHNDVQRSRTEPQLHRNDPHLHRNDVALKTPAQSLLDKFSGPNSLRTPQTNTSLAVLKMLDARRDSLKKDDPKEEKVLKTIEPIAMTSLEQLLQADKRRNSLSRTDGRYFDRARASITESCIQQIQNSRKKLMEPSRTSRVLRDSPARSDTTACKWASKKSVSKGSDDHGNSLISDPRYVHLEEALCPFKSTNKPIDVHTLVANLSSLHVPAKTPSSRTNKRRPFELSKAAIESWKKVATLSQVSRVFSPVLLEREEESSFSSWSRKKSDKEDKSCSMIRDPRYSHSEQSLCPLKSNGVQMDLKTVVENLESLHLPPRTPKEAKPRIELKAMPMEFMKERGIVF